MFILFRISHYMLLYNFYYHFLASAQNLTNLRDENENYWVKRNEK